MESVNTAGERQGLVAALRSDLGRLGRITSVLVRHGFSSLFERVGLEDSDTEPAPAPGGSDVLDQSPSETARRFRLVLEELGPTFVKVGQILSTRPDLVPPVFLDELKKLQSSVPPVAFDEIRTVLEASLGGPSSKHFANFETSPLASASMAQAHLAQLPDGTEVVVKVLRPGIREVIRADLDLLRWLAWVLETTIAEMQLYTPRDMVAALEEALTDELDFRREAIKLERFRRNYEGHPTLYIPRMFPTWSSADVLVMERIHGRNLTDIEPGSEDAKAYGKQILELAYTSIFDHGFFHGDPHPGNVFAMTEGRLGLIDFGMCGALSHQQRDHLITLILSVVSGDHDGIARVLMRMGQPIGRVHLADFKADIADIRERFLLRDLKEINVAAFLDECMDAAQRHRIRIGGAYLVLGKAVVTMEGILRYLDPHLDLVGALQPYAKRLLKHRFDPDRALERSMAGVLHVAQLAREVPDQLSQVLMDLENGHLRVQVSSQEVVDVRREMSRQTTRMALALFACATLIAAVLLLPNEPWHAGERGVPVLTSLLVLVSLGSAWLCLLTHLAGRSFTGVRLGPLMRILGRN